MFSFVNNAEIYHENYHKIKKKTCLENQYFIENKRIFLKKTWLFTKNWLD